MARNTRNDNDLEGLLRRALDMAEEVRPGWQMQHLIKEALVAGGYEGEELIERDPYTRPIPGPAEAPRFTTAPGRHRNLKPEAAEKEKQAVLDAVNKARDAMKEELADPIVVTAADLEDEDPEPELPTTDPNGPNHGQDTDASFMGKNDNGSGISREDTAGASVGTRNDQEPSKGNDKEPGKSSDKPADVHADSMTVNSESTTVNTGNTPGPAEAKKDKENTP